MDANTTTPTGTVRTGIGPTRIGPVSDAIFRLARLHKTLAGSLLREAGLHPGQELVLMTLWNDGPQRQVDLARTLDSDAPTMTRSIGRLERVGLVRREPSSTDARSIIVHATEESLSLKSAVERAWGELERLTTEGIDPIRVRQILDAMGALEANLVRTEGRGVSS